MTIVLTATLTDRRWELIAADPDIVMARLFAAAHRGPFRLAGQPA